MKFPRDIGGEELAILLRKYGYRVTRQTGSHMRLTSTIKGEHHLTIPKHKPIKVGTLNNILSDVADYLKKDKQKLIEELFG
ncbi:MAG: type II toxin-antitoxin system HicA family toxin [candidate division WOR-3 bacterium]